MPKVSVKTIAGVVISISVIGALGYTYIEGSSVIKNNSAYESRIRTITNQIDELKATQDDTSISEENLQKANSGYETMMSVVQQVSASQETLLSNLENGFVITEQRKILTSLVSNLSGDTGLFISVDVPATYRVEYALVAEYEANSTTIPLVFNYYANDSLIYVVSAAYSVTDNTIRIGDVFETSLTYQFNRTNAFGETNTIYSSSDYTSSSGAPSTKFRHGDTIESSGSSTTIESSSSSTEEGVVSNE